MVHLFQDGFGWTPGASRSAPCMFVSEARAKGQQLQKTCDSPGGSQKHERLSLALQVYIKPPLGHVL